MMASASAVINLNIQQLPAIKDLIREACTQRDQALADLALECNAVTRLSTMARDLGTQLDKADAEIVHLHAACRSLDLENTQLRREVFRQRQPGPTQPAGTL